MTHIDLESLTTVLGDAAPAGEDLEYDLAFLDLEETAKGTPEQSVRIKDPDDPSREIDRVVPGEEPDARAMLAKAEDLFGRTRDLRVALHYGYALTRLHGVTGLGDALTLLAGMLERLWDHVHPQLQADDGFDPFFRVNVLAGLVDPERFFKAAQGAVFLESRAIGRFTLRDIEVARGDLSPLEGQLSPTPELFAAALQDADGESVAERLAALETALENLKRIQSIVSEHGGDLNVTRLQKVLNGARDVLSGPRGADTAAVAAGTVSVDGAEAVAVASGGGVVAAGGGAARLASRADAQRLLEMVAEFLERSEPCHPAPIFIRRASRLLEMNFLEIVQELTPDAMSEIRHIGGIRSEEY